MQEKKKRKIKNVNELREPTTSRPKITPDRLVEEIRERAREIFWERGASPGDALDDWLRAEREITSKYDLNGAKS